jgi:hypothetical protein
LFVADSVVVAALERLRLETIEEQAKRDAEQAKRDAELRSEVRALKDVFQSHETVSPTAATLGQNTALRLKEGMRWHRPNNESGPAIFDATAFAAFQQLDLQGRSESALIEHVTTHLVKAHSSSSLMLVNSERHGWVRDAHNGKPSAPDLFSAPSIACEPRQGPSEKVPSGAKIPHFMFGNLAHWCLRDMVEVVWEFKVEEGPNEFRALGELVQYLQHIYHVKQLDVVNRDCLQHQRGVAADRHRLLLVTASHGVIEECTELSWGEAGSFECLQSFVKPAQELNPWQRAVTAVCTQFSLTIPQHEKDGRPIFLGCGASGRVFRALDGHQQGVAVKVCLGDTDISRLSEEHSKYTKHAEALKKSSAATSCLGFHAVGRLCAGLVVAPLGTKLPKNKKSVESALCALRRLHDQGLSHGDARVHNVVWIEDKDCALWVDFRTLDASFDTSFTADVKTFAVSLGLDITEDPTTMDIPNIVQLFAPLWR